MKAGSQRAGVARDIVERGGDGGLDLPGGVGRQAHRAGGEDHVDVRGAHGSQPGRQVADLVTTTRGGLARGRLEAGDEGAQRTLLVGGEVGQDPPFVPEVASATVDHRERLQDPVVHLAPDALTLGEPPILDDEEMARVIRQMKNMSYGLAPDLDGVEDTARKRA